MSNRYNCNPKELTQARVTFWCYVVSIPIIIFLYLLPMIRGEAIVFSPISLIYPAIVLFLLYQGYRSMRVMLSVKSSYCEVTEDRVVGISTPSPFRKAIPFDLERSEILGIAKTNVSIGGIRSFEALALNTKDRQIILFAIERIADLKAELEK